MKKYGNTEWQYMAAMARDHASRMRSNNDVDAETGKYIYAIVDEYDRNASLALKRIYEDEDVQSVDICTEQGGYQTICVKYTNGTEYNFDTNGHYDSLDDMICHEIYAYITGRIDESNTNMEKNKNVVRLTESKLKQIVAESVKKVLNEMTTESYVNSRYQHVIEIKEIYAKLQKLYVELSNKQRELPSALSQERDEIGYTKSLIGNASENLREYLTKTINNLNNATEYGVKYQGLKQPEWYPINSQQVYNSIYKSIHNLI